MLKESYHIHRMLKVSFFHIQNAQIVLYNKCSRYLITFKMHNVSFFPYPKYSKSVIYQILASVAELDVHPTGDQEVAGLTPVGSA